MNVTRLEAYNQNHTEKVAEYNQNAETKTAEFDSNAAALQTEVDRLRGECDQLAEENRKQENRIDALIKLNKGQTYDVLEQESEAYSVDVPSGAKYVGIDKVGGKSVVFAQYCNFAEGRSVEKWGVTLTVKDSCTLILNGTCNSTDWTYSSVVELLKGGFTPLREKNMLAIGGGNGISFEAAKGIGVKMSFTEGVTYTDYEISLNLIDRDKIGLTDEEIKAILSKPMGYNEGEIISSQTDRVDAASADGAITQQITTGFPVLNSAGSVYDYIDLNEGKLHQRVGVVDMGILTWEANATSRFYATLPQNAAIKSSYNEYTNVMCANYDSKTLNQIYASNKGITTHPLLGVNVWIYDSDYTDTGLLKSALSGQILHYELAEEIVTDITIPTELTDWLEAEPGGTVTFKNADESKQLPVPNAVSWVRKLDEVE